MSRLQEYLRTPTPSYRQFFTPRSCHQEDAQNLFSQEVALPIKGPQDYTKTRRNIVQKMDRGSAVLNSQNLSVIAPQNRTKMIDQKLNFDDLISEEIRTPKSSREKDQALLTTAQKKYNLRANQNFTPNFADGRQNERTLRILTAQAYDIVCQKGSTTYRQVSEVIIGSSSDIPSNREQKNIKRRVYDALNVLIALGKLEKRGRRISPKRCAEKQRMKRDYITQLKRSLAQKQARVIQKQKYYRCELKKYQNIKKLVQRNSNDKKMKNTKDGKERGKIIMPFILTNYENVMDFSEQQSEAKIIVDKNKTNTTMIADMDVLEFLKFRKQR